MPTFLVPVDSGQCLIPLEKAIVMIGRQADCDVSLTHSRKISRRHCCIAQVNDKFVVRDLGSTNGVYLNGYRVQKEAEIGLGDDLIIGDVHFKLLNEIPASSNPNLPRANNAAGRTVQGSANPPQRPHLPGPGRSTGATPIHKVTSLEEDDVLKLDGVDEESDANSRSPSTRDGIRRFRSSR
jgi:pSer/pThr/pTyr-binding forkhead associated (FHA) protein